MLYDETGHLPMGRMTIMVWSQTILGLLGELLGAFPLALTLCSYHSLKMMKEQEQTARDNNGTLPT